MRQYHTSLEINAPVEVVWNYLVDFGSYPAWNPLVGSLKGNIEEGGQISTYPIPLGKTYHPTILAFEKNKQLVWRGVKGAGFLLAGKHYYQLEKTDVNTTQFRHGEWFTGLFSWFLPNRLLMKMERAFIEHNNVLKQRIENEK